MRKLYVWFVSCVARILFPKRRVVFETNVTDDETAVFVCNHSGLIGPVCMQLYFNMPKKIWMTSAMVNKETNVNYFFHDMLLGRSSKHPKFTRFLAKVALFFFCPLLNNNPNLILVHKDQKEIMSTFKQSLNALNNGENLVIFPEKHLRFGKFVNSMHTGFVSVAKLHFNKTGKKLKFYPVYVGNQLKTINVGSPIEFNPEIHIKQQSQTVCNHLQNEIEKIGASLPNHNVVPYVPPAFYQFYGEFENDEMGFYRFVNKKSGD